MTSLLRALLSAAVLLVATAPLVFAQSGVRDSRDGTQILVNKDVGEERWAIAYDHATGTITGNVFFPDGGDPAFIWCAQEGDISPVESGAPDLELACYGSDACEDAPCAGPAWELIAEVTLPVSFFLVDEGPVATPAPTATPTPSPAPPTPTPAATQAPVVVPSSPDALFAFLQSRQYESFAAESSVHPTNAPHMAAVRTFVNPALESSLAAGASSHPVGSATIKEMYDGNGALAGWAAMVKVSASDGNDGNAWYWYEVFDTESDAAQIQGIGHPSCTGCHQSGSDYVRVPFPLQ